MGYSSFLPDDTISPNSIIFPILLTLQLSNDTIVSKKGDRVKRLKKGEVICMKNKNRKAE
jgi:hypothetical protein